MFQKKMARTRLCLNDQKRKKVVCFKCHGEGHYAYRCPNNNKGTVPTVPKEKLSSNVTEAKEAENVKGLSLLAKTQSRF